MVLLTSSGLAVWRLDGVGVRPRREEALCVRDPQVGLPSSFSVGPTSTNNLSA